MLKVLVDEEYGFRTWMWLFPGTKEQLIEAWRKKEAPLNFIDPSVGQNGVLFKGTMEETLVIPLFTEYDAVAHVHEIEDTYLIVDDILYHGDGKIERRRSRINLISRL
jgi:hypothetical protein